MKLDGAPSMRRYGVSRFYTRHRLAVLLVTLLCLGLIAKLRQPARPRNCQGGIPLPQILAQQRKSGATANFAATTAGWRPGARCANYPQDASLVIVVKTGATEAFSKLPTLLLTYLSCVPPENVLFFSDMAGTIGNFAIHDSLDTATADATKDNPDFDLYNNQKELRQLGQNMDSLRNEWKSEAAWRLDKYKNLYTAQKAWDLAPDRNWYLYIDADTYISWTNLFLWLATLDATKPLYLGSQVDVGRPPFAHGGSGYLLSKPAMQLLVGDDRKSLAKEFDKNATTACCGDQELGRTLFKKGLKVQNVRPVINGKNPREFNFGPELWCTPVATMHHVGSEEVQDMWDFENQRNSTKEPLLMEELYYTMIASLMTTPRRDDWDNQSPFDQLRPDPILTPNHVGDFDFFHHDPTKSYNHCRKACQKDKDCFQFVYSKDSCKFDTAFTLGKPRYPKKAEDGGEEIRFQSGWLVERIQKWIAQNSPCPGPNWEKDH
ncbi:hypothetical protein VE01_05505 [Pseudogymnoascus verrucosus]|uniref:Glycosyltransferase family 31 protein n=1 Tax=Pseudogymnoascus verrucosus TaxID=342668 RepID=A0A1B8GM48_9PEZI|nr:uncharacterized protein VE01_05505 [Pseudogymnoascus verrucosus]OBT96910.1 hypothetical protein VE01_05505 [Pseudogymnoascus verrucosus]